MIWKICFAMSLIFLAAGAVMFIYKRYHGKGGVRYLGGGVFLSAVSICFPVMHLTENDGFALAMSISQSIRMFVIDTGTSDILDVLQQDALGSIYIPYKIVVCILYLLGPVFTLSVVLRYFSNFFERLRIFFSSRKNLYIFSDLTEKSLEVATNLVEKDEKKKSAILFCNSNAKDDENVELEEKARVIGAILVPQEASRLHLKNKKRYLTYFQISDDEEKNLDCTLAMIDRMTEKNLKKYGATEQNITIYCFASGDEKEILLDAKDKRNLRVILIDEIRDSVYEHLYRYPLYANQNSTEKNGKLSVLIVGGGKIGTEFLKATVWMGQMKSLDLEIYMIDLKGNLRRKSFSARCPELLQEDSDYQIDIHKGNIFSKKIELYLNELKDINYCMVSLGEDEKSLRAALALRGYFYRRYKKVQPVISVYVESRKKREAIRNLNETTRTKEKYYYDIVPFGNGGIYQSQQGSEALLIEYLGLGIHAHYCRLKKEDNRETRREVIKGYYSRQYNRRSSIAGGMHISSKLWEMGLGIIRVPENECEKKLFQKFVHPVNYEERTENIRKTCYSLEHDRWMAYVRAEGWSLATEGGKNIDDIRECYEQYCQVFKNQNYPDKLHPALIPLESDDPQIATLQQVDDMIVQVNKKLGLEYEPRYVESDEEVVDHIGEIVSGEWCGEEGIVLNGRVVQANEWIIADLGEILQYDTEILKREEAKMSLEKRLALQYEMMRCRNGKISL